MKILFLSAEVAPYVSVGGLSQVMYFLPRALAERGHDVRVFTPRHGAMEKVIRTRPDLTFDVDVAKLRVPIGVEDTSRDTHAAAAAATATHEREAIEFGGSAAMVEPHPIEAAPSTTEGDIVCDVLRFAPPNGDAPTYFLANDEYYGLRANVFGYADDHVRFALLSKACLVWLLDMKRRVDAGDEDAWFPDVVHCHDWHASYAIDLARRGDRFRVPLQKVPFVLTVHNFRFQGNADFRYVPAAEKDDGSAPLEALTSPLLQRQNALLRGLLHADAITTVSPTHAREVLTEEYADGLQETLLTVRGRLSGIMNGIDTKEFDPATDAIIAKKFSKWTAMAGRAANKRALQREFALPERDDVLVFGYVGRLSAQKGIELIIPALATLLENRDDVQFICVGGGEDRFRAALEELRARFPEKVGLYLMSDFRLPRKLFAGCDVMLMPSVFEPGGIVALEAMRFGAVPMVRRTGGLADSVAAFDVETGKGNGFSFVRKDPWALYGAMVEALVVFKQRSLWKKLVANCMACDFSWKHAAEAYDEWYGRTLALHRRATDKSGGRRSPLDILINRPGSHD